MDRLKVAGYQMRVSADLDANFRNIRRAVRRAASEKADLLVLPECAISGYPPLHYKSPSEIDAARIAELNGEVCDLAKKHSIRVVLGTILMSSEGLLNSALVISKRGRIVGRQDKLHLTGPDKEFFAPGVGARIFEIKGLKVGVLICYDARFPEPFRYLRERGARMIAVISNACGGETWKLPVLEGTYRCRAAENSCFVVAVNAAGPLQMATSRICDPLGLDLAAARKETQQMIFADLDLAATDTGCFYDRRTDQFAVVGLFEGL
jgi:predicted amidohydrolase